jgi:CDGSH iron-sulfur domain-containing protein 3
LVEHELPKLGVAGSNPVARSIHSPAFSTDSAFLAADAVAKAVFHNPNKRTISMTDPVIFQKSPMPIEVEEGKTYFWCACGKSAKQPFCDGSHKDTGIAPVKITAEATKKMFFCGCKASAKAPLCDGSHSKL